MKKKLNKISDCRNNSKSESNITFSNNNHSKGSNNRKNDSNYKQTRN